MTRLLTATATLLALAAPAVAAGDAEKGEQLFNRCKACHMIKSEDEMIVRGGRVGPNLYGVIGREAGSVEGFRYGSSLEKAGEEGLVWGQENLAAYTEDPKGFLADYLEQDSARSKMAFRLRNGAEDVAAYLATFSED